MKLAEYQQQVYQLLCGNTSTEGDEQDWVVESRTDGSAALLKGFGRWWIAYHLRKNCILSSALLQRLDLWEETIKQTTNHAYIPDLLNAFLGELTRHRHPLVATLAEFELAMVRVKQGDDGSYEIPWQTHPVALINALLENDDLPEWGMGHYQTTVSASFPHLFKVYEVDGPTEHSAGA